MPEGPLAAGSWYQGLQAQGMPDRGLELLFWVGWSQPRSESQPSPWQTVPAWGSEVSAKRTKGWSGDAGCCYSRTGPGWSGRPPWWVEGAGIPLQPRTPIPPTSPLPIARLV